MIRYRLIGMEGGSAIYSYAVEGKPDDVGRVVVDLANGTYEVAELAPTDKAVGYPWYGSKMKHAIDAITRDETPLESGTIAWY